MNEGICIHLSSVLVRRYFIVLNLSIDPPLSLIYPLVSFLLQNSRLKYSLSGLDEHGCKNSHLHYTLFSKIFVSSYCITSR